MKIINMRWCALIGVVFFGLACMQNPENNPELKKRFEKYDEIVEEFEKSKVFMEDLDLEIDTIHDEINDLNAAGGAEAAQKLAAMQKKLQTNEAEVVALKTKITELEKKLNSQSKKISSIPSPLVSSVWNAMRSLFDNA